VLADEHLELANELGVTAEGEVGFDAQLQHDQPMLIET
jgi:hypothetical protein